MHGWHVGGRSDTVTTRDRLLPSVQATERLTGTDKDAGSLGETQLRTAQDKQVPRIWS